MTELIEGFYFEKSLDGTITTTKIYYVTQVNENLVLESKEGIQIFSLEPTIERLSPLEMSPDEYIAKCRAESSIACNKARSLERTARIKEDLASFVEKKLGEF